MTAAALTDEQYDLVRSYAIGEAPAQLARDRGLTRADVVHQLTELCELNPELARHVAADEEQRRTSPPQTETPETIDVGPVQAGPQLEYRAYRCHTCNRIGPEACNRVGHASGLVIVRILDAGDAP